jgi:hypothetical protein
MSPELFETDVPGNDSSASCFEPVQLSLGWITRRDPASQRSPKRGMNRSVQFISIWSAVHFPTHLLAVRASVWIWPLPGAGM